MAIVKFALEHGAIQVGPLPETRRRNWGETSASQSNSVQRTTNRICTLPTQVRFPGTARDFSPRINFQCRLSYGVRTHPCAIAYINKCSHVKHHAFHVRVRWIMKTLKLKHYESRTLRKATRISHGKKKNSRLKKLKTSPFAFRSRRW